MLFSELDHDEQARWLKGLAERVLPQFGLEGASIRLLAHSASTTFRVDDAAGGRFVLRIQPQGEQEGPLRSEQEWLGWLLKQGIAVPEPVAARDGRKLVTASSPSIPGTRLCQLARWVDGEPLESGLTAELYGQVGEFVARLHDAAERFEPGKAFERPRWDCSNLAGQVPESSFPLLSRHQREMLRQAAAQIERQVARLGRRSKDFGIIHSDLQPANLLIHKGEIRAIDFADCGWGHYWFDIAASILRMAGRPDFALMRCAFLKGYRSVRDLPDEEEPVLPALMAARGIYVSAWVAQHWQSPSIRRYGEEVVPYILGLIRSYLDRGESNQADGQTNLQALTTVEFLSHLRGLGIDLQPAGDRLRFSAPKGVLTPALRQELSQRKADILRLIRATESQRH